jgi:hypothetical protein
MQIEHIIFYHPKNAACLVDYGNLSVLVDTSRSSKLDALDYEIKKNALIFVLCSLSAQQETFGDSVFREK